MFTKVLAICVVGAALSGCGTVASTVDCIDGCSPEQGPAGADGAPGTDGVDGQPGHDGIPGNNGIDGYDGHDSLIVQVPFTEDKKDKNRRCKSGHGVYIYTGLDLDYSGTLDADEVLQESYICGKLK